MVVEKLAVETPALVVIDPVPVATAAPVQVALAYRVKVTTPVGATEVVLVKVAVSVTAMGTPAVPVTGLATVVILGVAWPMASCSWASPHPVVNAALLASPA